MFTVAGEVVAEVPLNGHDTTHSNSVVLKRGGEVKFRVVSVPPALIQVTPPSVDFFHWYVRLPARLVPVIVKA